MVVASAIRHRAMLALPVPPARAKVAVRRNRRRRRRQLKRRRCASGSHWRTLRLRPSPLQQLLQNQHSSRSWLQQHAEHNEATIKNNNNNKKSAVRCAVGPTTVPDHCA